MSVCLQPAVVNSAAAAAQAAKDKAGADLGFYKGGCPIYLKGAPEVERPPPMLPEPNNFLALEEIVGVRRSYDI